MQHAVQNATPLNTEGFAHPAKNVGALGIEPGMLVADFGSGSGAYVLAIAERLEGTGHIYAIDIQKDLLRRIANETKRRGFKNVEVIWADLDTHNASKLSDKTLDLVLLSNILFQISDKRALLEEAHRILKQSGKVVIIDWSDSFGGLGPVPDHVVSKDKALEFGEKVGLKFVREFSAGAHHYGLVFRKSE